MSAPERNARARGVIPAVLGYAEHVGPYVGSRRRARRPGGAS